MVRPWHATVVMTLPCENGKPVRVTLEVRKVNGSDVRGSMNTSGPARSPVAVVVALQVGHEGRARVLLHAHPEPQRQALQVDPLLPVSLSLFDVVPIPRVHDDVHDLPLGILDEAVLEVERLQEPDPHAHVHQEQSVHATGVLHSSSSWLRP